MYAFEKYGIQVGQIWNPADGSKWSVEVIDVDTYKDVDDVVIRYLHDDTTWRIDCFKLTYRFYLPKEGK